MYVCVFVIVYVDHEYYNYYFFEKTTVVLHFF